MATTESGPSASPHLLCTLCNHHPAIYTCPRCATRSCSLPCAAAHKARSGCSGERDRAAYVPMNRYTWGTMMDDYVFLEDVGRRVGEWGGEIARGGFRPAGVPAGRGRGRGRGRGQDRGRGGGREWRSAPGRRTKREVLRMQLEEHDIEMDILPAGMERHKINTSFWDFKTQNALLTIKFIFHPPSNPLAPPSQPPDPPYTLLTHRNSLKTPLLALIQRHIADKKGDTCPAWVHVLVCPDADAPDAFAPPQCVMLAPLDPLAASSSSQARPQRRYYRFDTTQNLATLLRHTHFVEFPTIEVWEEFQGTLVDKEGVVTQTAQDQEHEPKRRKLDRRAGRQAIAALLDGYGSSGEDESTEKEKPQDGLEKLGGYSGSDDDAEDGADIQNEGDMDDDEVELDPVALLEIVRSAQRDDNWTRDMGDDLVDWGESDEDMQ